MAIIDFGGTKEQVITRKEFPMAKARKVLKDETIAIIGYGVQGPAQSLNLRDNGFKVIDWPGQRLQARLGPRGQGRLGAGQDAVRDRGGGAPGHHHPDAGVGRRPARHLAGGEEESQGRRRALFLARLFHRLQEADRGRAAEERGRDHGRPQRLRTSVRRNFLTGAGINSSFAVEQDATGHAEERCLAIGIGIGSGYLFPTTFQHEVFSDLTGERGVLMGALAGIMEAQYDVLRAHQHSPSEAFNETVEELTQSLIRLVDENGMDWMYSNCSATAQRGALDWKPRFKKAVLPVFKELYERVKSGKECARVLSSLRPA